MALGRGDATGWLGYAVAFAAAAGKNRELVSRCFYVVLAVVWVVMSVGVEGLGRRARVGAKELLGGGRAPGRPKAD